MNSEIAVIIPTYNRPDCIKIFCETSLGTLQGTRFHLYVFDSSPNNETYDVINNFDKQNLITYVRVRNELTADDKVINAIYEIQEKYIYILGDGNLVDFHMLDNILFSATNDFLLVHIEPISRIGYLSQDSNYSPNELYIYDDVKLYVEKYFSNLTYWGASIVRRDDFLSSLNKHLNKYRIDKITWWLPCILVECLLVNSGDIGVVYTTALNYNPAKTTRSWDSGENYYNVVFRIFNANVKSLPSTISDDSKKVIIRFFREDCLANRKYLIKKRLDNSITIRLTIKYKDDISAIPGYYGRIYVLSICPRFILKVIWLIERCILKFASKVKHFIRRKKK